MALTHLEPSASPEQVAEAIARDGAVIVDRVTDSDTLARVRAEMQPHLDATPVGVDDFGGYRTRRTGGLIARSPASRGLITHPTVLGTVERVLAHATNYQLHLTQVIAIGPGESAQGLHRDRWAFDFYPFTNDYEVQCNTIWAMVDFTEENGATRVVPGSHTAPDGTTYTMEDSVPAEMEAGSVLFYTGSTYHGGGANDSDDVRLGLNITYNVAWLRQEENQYLTVPLELARTLDDDLLRLMGYARGAYALGYVDDLRDPIEVVRGSTGVRGFGDH